MCPASIVNGKPFLIRLQHGQQNAATKQAYDNAQAASRKATIDAKVARDAALVD